MTLDDVLIRRELPTDQRAVFDVHNAAFATDDGSPAGEATLVDELRAAGDSIAELSLVAEVDGQVVGHVLCSRADLDGRPSIGLAPLAVLPNHQKHGIGGALMHAVIGAADALDFPEVLLLGDPAYYRRFGFQPAQRLGVTPPDLEWGQHFQIRTLNTWSDGRTGAFRYAQAFGID